MVTAAMKLKTLLGRQTVSSLDNILKSRDITLPTKVYLVKAMVLPPVMYRCESVCVCMYVCVCVCVLVTQLCLTLCDAMDYSPPGSSFHGILQARVLEWVAISFSIQLPLCMCVCVCVLVAVMSDSL